MLTILALLVVLSVLILVHEFGHFIAAKSVDIAAPRFSLGLGPRVAGFRWGETDFVLSAIPLGGYVKMAGMGDDEAAEGLEGGAGNDDPPVDPSRTFDSKPLWARAWVISAGVIMNFLFAVLVFAAMGLFYGEAHIATRQLSPDPDAQGAPTALRALPRGTEVVEVGGEPVETYDDFARAVLEAPAGPLTLRFANAPEMTVELPAAERDRVALLSALPPLYPARVGQVIAGTPADRAGLEGGDRIVQIGDTPVTSWNEAVTLIQAGRERALPFVVERDGRRVPLTITPESGLEGGREVGKIGAAVDVPTVYRPLGAGDAIQAGFQQTWGVTRMIVTFLGRMISGQESARQMGGLLAIGEMSGQAAHAGMYTFLGFLAMFSVNLAVLNLLPIPILDGGHLMFLAIEAVRGRPLSVEARIRLSHVGLIIVVALMLWANGNDILRRLGI